MTDPVQQALDDVNEGIGTEHYGQVRAALMALKTIREALQSAAQEAEDWRAIEAWQNQTDRIAVAIVALHSAGTVPEPFTGVDHGTFAAALSKAAEFCRKELAK